MLSLRYGTRPNLRGLAVRRLDAAEGQGTDAQRDFRPAISVSTESPGPYDTLPPLLNSPRRRYPFVAGVPLLAHSAEIDALIVGFGDHLGH
jgi:hypothetical protein